MHPISIAAQQGVRWTRGSTEIWVLKGDCRIVQGASSARAQQAVLWIVRDSRFEAGRTRVVAYLEGEVRVDRRHDTVAAKVADRAWLGRFLTEAHAYVDVRHRAERPEAEPPIFARAVARRDQGPQAAVVRAQNEPAAPAPRGGTPTPAPAPPDSETPGLLPRALAAPQTGPEPAIESAAPPPGTRRIRLFSRSDVRIRARWFPDPDTNVGIAVIDAGVNLIIDNLQGYGTLDISADRVVIWTTAEQEPGLRGETVQDDQTPLEVYMEGNVVFRQGERVIYADRMYYDVRSHRGTVLGAEILTPAPGYEGLLRFRSEVVQQTGRDRFFARESFITSSRMGIPRYRLQASQIEFQDIQQPRIDPFTGAPRLDPETLEPTVDHQQLATARNNFLLLGEVPVFYWPIIAADVSDPTYYIRRAQYKNDKTYGHQILTEWDAFQLLGIGDKPAGTNWDVSLDYLSKRGFGHGTTFTYNRPRLLWLDGPASGLLDYWGIKDHGDDLISGPGWVPPEADYRYRLFSRHRQELAREFQLTGELGWISDRNFLQQYFTREWDTFKDQTTGVELKRTRDNISWSITADARVNDFFTQTEWLPRGDHFWLGQPVAEALTWFEHSSAAYARFRTTTVPTAAQDAALFTYLPWESPAPRGAPLVPLDAEGERLATRQEIDWPFQLGPVKVVPYALGELAHWGEDREGDDLQRVYYQTGVRASLPMWRTFPQIESQLWNVHGIAHKVVFDAEFAFSEANRDLDDLPLYDPIDDDSIETIRRRFAVTTFGVPAGTVAAIPRQFDERLYAVRSGLAGAVTGPTEIAEDLMALRLGMRHRWQTKRGRPDRRRIIDWITLDTNAVVFPDPDRDNFGTSVGLVDYDFRWFVGDRLTLSSEGLFDFFQDGAQIITIGAHLQRPPRGNVYVGLRLLEGPISSQVFITSLAYRMSPKWYGLVSASVDLKGENIGQSVSVTRIGESLLMSLGVSVDAIRGDSSVFFAVEPRFLPKGRLARATSVETAGLRKLE